MERLTFRLLGLATLLVLFAWDEITKPNLLGIGEIHNKSIILVALLLLVGYTQYDLLSTLAKFDRLTVIYKIIVKHRHRVIHDQGLAEYFLFYPTLYDYGFAAVGQGKSIAQSLLWVVEFFAVTLVIPLGAELVALSNLRAPTGLTNYVLFPVNLIITLAFNLQSVLIVFSLFRGIRQM